MTNEQKKQLLLDLIKIEENGEIFNFTRAERAEFQKWIDGLIDQEPRWIPVSERLPTKEEYIANNGLFIVSDGNRTYVEYFVIYKSFKCFCTMNGFRVDRCVIAWMPLPKPYEPQESEDKG